MPNLDKLTHLIPGYVLFQNADGTQWLLIGRTQEKNVVHFFWMKWSRAGKVRFENSFHTVFRGDLDR